MKKSYIRYAIPIVSSWLFLASAYGEEGLIPPDHVTKEAEIACIGLAQKYASESRRFNPDDMKKFVMEQANDCRVFLSYSIFKPNTASIILDKIESDYGRFTPDVSEEEAKFRDYFHKNIMSGAQEAAKDKAFRDEMVTLGGFAIASPSHRNF